MEKDYKYYMDNGVVNFREGQFQKAIEQIDKSLELKKDWAIPYFYRGACNEVLEKNDEAMLDYAKAVSIDKNMTDAYYNMAQIILTRKDIKNPKIEDAVKYLNKALELDPKFQDAYYAMAAAYKKLGEYQKSLEYLEKLLEIQPDHIYAKALKTLILEKYMV